MAMSKKHYTAIAKILAAYHQEDKDMRVMALCLAHDLALFFAKDNPRFDGDRFMAAVCNYPTEASSF